MLLSCGLELQLMRMFGGCCTASNLGCSLIDLSKGINRLVLMGMPQWGLSAVCCLC